MTKQLKRLNIKHRYDPRPVPPSGHRCLTIKKTPNRNYWIVTVKQKAARQFKVKKIALCYKFIMLLKIKSNYYTNGRKTTSNLPRKRPSKRETQKTYSP